jgi:hypothetical protein
MIGCISLNFDITSYKIILDLLYLSLRFLRDNESPNFTSI